MNKDTVSDKIAALKKMKKKKALKLIKGTTTKGIKSKGIKSKGIKSTEKKGTAIKGTAIKQKISDIVDVDINKNLIHPTDPVFTLNEKVSQPSDFLTKLNEQGIDIGIPCTLGCEQFLYICLLTMIKTAHNPQRLHFHIGIDLHFMSIAMAKKIIKIKMIKELIPNMNLHYVKTQLPHSSLSHSRVLNLLFSKFTQKYGLLCDSDLGFLYYGWDNLFLSKMSNKIKAVGVHTNDRIHLRAFPTLHCVMMENKIIRDLNIDFKPGGTDIPTPPPEFPADEMTSKVYNVPIGTSIRLDTGSELCRLFYENKYLGHYFDCFSGELKNTDKCKFLTAFLINRHNSEYQNEIGELILTHHRSSVKNAVKFRTPDRSQYKIIYKLPVRSIAWIDRIADYLLKRYNINIVNEANMINSNFK